MRSIFIVFSLYCLFACLTNFHLQAADTTIIVNKSDLRYGIYGHYGMNYHFTNFSKLPGIPNCCPKFEEGSSTGFDFGLLVEYPLSKLFDIELRAGYSVLDGDLSRTEPTTVIVEGKHVDGEFKHSLNSSLSDIHLEPVLSLKFFNYLRLFFSFHGGYMVTKNYEQEERIVKPSGKATFLDSLGNDTRSRMRNVSSGDIPDASDFLAFVRGGISYEFPLTSDRSLTIAPEFSYSKGLMDVVKDREWKIDPIHIGVAIKYRNIKKRIEIEERDYLEEIDTLKIVSAEILKRKFSLGYPRVSVDTTVEGNLTTINESFRRTDTIFIPKIFKLNADINAVGVNSQGEEIINPIFRVEEFLYTRLHPLLHYVFFAEGSHEIPDRYSFLKQNETKQFYVEKLYKYETLPIYWHILNIVGRRMTKYPEAKLKIVGCNCNLGIEKGDKKLSMKRAETVRDYLLNVWNLDEDRLTVEARNLPEKESNPIREPDKIVENRRVELYSDVYEILEPVLTTDTIRTCEPPIARFKPRVEAEAGIKKWIVNAIIDENAKKEYSSTQYASAEKIPDKIDWNINEDRENIWKLRDTINYGLSVEDLRNQDTVITDKFLPIEQFTLRKKMLNKIGGKIIDKYNLILFDFDKHYIGDHNKKISDFIKSRIKPESVIKITGYTDRTGDSTHNERLSNNRAKSTKESIGRDDATFKGVGETRLLYGNDIPEGRFYCRTVEIVVETPIEGE